MNDTYKTIQNPSKASFFKEKGSKFFGYAFPISTEGDVKGSIEILKKQHPSAGHFCYAWQLGQESYRFRVNDDGEPSNTAGTSIYGQIQSFDVTNILLVSVRYFGGTKLGVGGLKQAYKHSAQLTLEEAEIVERTMDVFYRLTFDYELMNKVMRVIKELNITLLKQEMKIGCECHIAVRKRDEEKTLKRFKNLYKVKVELMA